MVLNKEYLLNYAESVHEQFRNLAHEKIKNIICICLLELFAIFISILDENYYIGIIMLFLCIPFIIISAIEKDKLTSVLFFVGSVSLLFGLLILIIFMYITARDFTYGYMVNIIWGLILLIQILIEELIVFKNIKKNKYTDKKINKSIPITMRVTAALIFLGQLIWMSMKDILPEYNIQYFFISYTIIMSICVINFGLSYFQRYLFYKTIKKL